MFIPEGVTGSWFSGIVNSIFRNRRSQRYYNTNYLLGTKSALWIDRENLWQVYRDLPHLNIVINKRAELLSSGKIKLRNIASGEEILTHDVLKLLRKPNPLQSFSEFVTQYLVFKDVYGNAILYKNRKLFGEIPGGLWNLPPWTIRINSTGKIFDQIEVEGIIESYTMLLAGKSTDFKPNQIILKNDNIDSEYLKSNSKILSLVKPLSNLAATLQTTNVMLYESGGKGILSNSAKEDGGAIPLGEDERKRIEKDYINKYGVGDGQQRVIITNSSLQYQPMSFPIKDMDLTATDEREFGRILDAYGVDRDVFASIKGATNENKEAGLKATIQNTIQSEADDFCQTLTDNFGLYDLGLELYMSFEHLPVMQEDGLKTAQGYFQRVQAYTLLKTSGIISPDQVAELCEVKFDGTGISETQLKTDPKDPKNLNNAEEQEQ